MVDENLEATIPIREISRVTGVNSVTLRAWERRYGLIKPMRTHKGHRLYRKEDVELVNRIQAWLARGLAIGKISELLDSEQFAYEVHVENVWQSNLSELILLLSELNVGKWDAWFNNLFSVYPIDLISDQLIMPALEQLGQVGYGNAIKKSILVNRLCEYLFMLTHRQRQGAQRERIAIVQLTTETNALLNALLHYGLTASQFKSEVIGLNTANELIFAVKQLNLQAIIVNNHACTSLGDFQKELQQLSQKVDIPIVVAGSVAAAVDVETASHVRILRSGGTQAIFAALNQIFTISTNIAGER